MGKLAENINVRLAILNMTQKELAEAAGISQVMVHKLLSGKSKSTAKILDIAKALQCDAEVLSNGNCSALVDQQSPTPNLDTFLAESPTEEEASALLAYLHGMRVAK